MQPLSTVSSPGPAGIPTAEGEPADHYARSDVFAPRIGRRVTQEIPPTLSEAELSEAIAALSGWAIVDGKLHKEFVFESFVQAFGFMASAAIVAERSGHHPEWSNTYNRVWIDLVTHDAEGITRLDTRLADELNRLSSTS